jgi:molecular chaperone DnaK (HSP70)
MSQFNKYLEIIQERKDYNYNEGIFNNTLGLSTALALMLSVPYFAQLNNSVYTDREQENLVNQMNKMNEMNKQIKSTVKQEKNIKELIKQNYSNFKIEMENEEALDELSKPIKKLGELYYKIGRYKPNEVQQKEIKNLEEEISRLLKAPPFNFNDNKIESVIEKTREDSDPTGVDEYVSRIIGQIIVEF